jgi:hypothetical protein
VDGAECLAGLLDIPKAWAFTKVNSVAHVAPPVSICSQET